uniref:EGF-like domain-containing protein n=1 Tax=Clytia hemisphaerica TaxID=252671 RepID=A0A7M5WRL5_9CNID
MNRSAVGLVLLLAALASSHKPEEPTSASNHDIEADIKTRLNGNMQDLDTDKSILDNLLFQGRRQMQKDMNRRDFFNSLLEQLMQGGGDKSSEEKNRAFRKKIASTKIQQLIDDELIPPYFRELNLHMLLKKIHKSYLSHYFNDMTVRELYESMSDDINQGAVTKPTTLGHFISMANVTEENLFNMLNLTSKMDEDSFKAILNADLTKLYTCFDEFSLTKKLSLFQMIMKLKEMNSRPHIDFIREKLMLPASLGILQNQRHFEEHVMNGNFSNKMELCWILRDKLNELHYPPMRVFKDHGINDTHFLGDAMLLAKRNMEKPAPFGNRPTKINRLELSILEQTAINDFYPKLMVRKDVQLKPSAINMTLRKMKNDTDLNMDEITLLDYISMKLNASKEDLKKIMCLSQVAFYDQFGKVYEKVKLKHLLNDENRKNDTDMFDVISKKGQEIEDQSRMTFGMLKRSMKLTRDELAHHTVQDIIKNVVKVDSELFDTWFDMNSENREYNSRMKFSDVSYMLRNFIDDDHIELFSMRTATDGSIFSEEVYRGEFAKRKYIESVEYLMTKDLNTIFKMYMIDDFELEIKPFAAILEEIFGKAEGWWDHYFSPATMFLFRYHTFENLHGVFDREIRKIPLKRFAMIMKANDKGVQEMFMNMQLSSIKYLCPHLPKEELTLEDTMACVGLDANDMNEMFGATETLFNEHSTLMIDSVQNPFPESPLFNPQSMTLRQLVVFAASAENHLKEELYVLLKSMKEAMQDDGSSKLGELDYQLTLKDAFERVYKEDVDQDKVVDLMSQWLGYNARHVMQEMTIKDLLKDSNMTFSDFSQVPLGLLLRAVGPRKASKALQPFGVLAMRKCFGDGEKEMEETIEDCGLKHDKSVKLIGFDTIGKFNLTNLHRVVKQPLLGMDLSSILFKLNLKVQELFKIYRSKSIIELAAKSPKLAHKIADEEVLKNTTLVELASILSNHSMEIVAQLLGIPKDEDPKLGMIIQTLNVQKLKILKFTTIYRLISEFPSEEEIKIVQNAVRAYSRMSLGSLSAIFPLNMSMALEVDLKGKKLNTLQDMVMKLFGTSQEEFLAVDSSKNYTKFSELTTNYTIHQLLQLSLTMNPQEDLIKDVSIRKLVRNLRSVDPDFAVMLLTPVKELIKPEGTHGKDLLDDVYLGFKYFMTHNFKDLRVTELNSFYAMFNGTGIEKEKNLMYHIQKAHAGYMSYVPLLSLNVLRNIPNYQHFTVAELFMTTMHYNFNFFAEQFHKNKTLLNDFSNTKFGDLFDRLIPSVKKDSESAGWMRTLKYVTRHSSSESYEQPDHRKIQKMLFFSWFDLTLIFTADTLNFDMRLKFQGIQAIYLSLPLTSYGYLLNIENMEKSDMLFNDFRYHFGSDCVSCNTKAPTYRLSDIPLLTASPTILQTSSFYQIKGKLTNEEPNIDLTYTLDHKDGLSFDQKEPMILSVKQFKKFSKGSQMHRSDLYKKIQKIVGERMGSHTLPKLKDITSRSFGDVIKGGNNFPERKYSKMRVIDLFTHLSKDKTPDVLRKPIGKILSLKSQKKDLTLRRLVLKQGKMKGSMFSKQFEGLSNKTTMVLDQNLEDIRKCFPIDTDDSLLGLMNTIDGFNKSPKDFRNLKIKEADNILPLRIFFKKYQWSPKVQPATDFCHQINQIIESKFDVILQGLSREHRAKPDDIIQVFKFFSIDKEQMKMMFTGRLMNNPDFSQTMKSEIANKFHEHMEKLDLKELRGDQNKSQEVVPNNQEGGSGNASNPGNAGPQNFNQTDFLEGLLQGMNNGQSVFSMDPTKMSILEILTKLMGSSKKAVLYFMSHIDQSDDEKEIMTMMKLGELGFKSKDDLKGSMLDVIKMKSSKYHVVRNFLSSAPIGGIPDMKTNQQIKNFLENLGDESAPFVLRTLHLKSFDDLKEASIEHLYLKYFAKRISFKRFKMLSLKDILDKNTKTMSGEDLEKLRQKRIMYALQHSHMEQFSPHKGIGFQQFMEVPFTQMFSEIFEVDVNDVEIPAMGLKWNAVRTVLKRFTLSQLMKFNVINAEKPFVANFEAVFERFGKPLMESFLDIPIQVLISLCGADHVKKPLRVLLKECAGIEEDEKNMDQFGYTTQAFDYYKGPLRDSYIHYSIRQSLAIAMMESDPNFVKRTVDESFNLGTEDEASCELSDKFEDAVKTNIDVWAFLIALGVPGEDHSIFKKGIYEIFGKAGVSKKQFKNITTLDLAQLVQIRDPKKRPFVKSVYLLKQCNGESVAKPMNMSNHMEGMNLKDIIKDCQLESPIMDLIAGPEPIDIPFGMLKMEGEKDIGQMYFLDKDVSFYTAAHMLTHMVEDVRRLAGKSTIKELASKAEVDMETVLSSPLSEVGPKLLEIPRNSFVGLFKVNESSINVSLSLREIGKMFATIMNEEKGNDKKIVMMKLTELFDFNPNDPKVQMKVNPMSLLPIDKFAHLFNISKTALMSKTISKIYEEFFGTNYTKMVESEDAKKFADFTVEMLMAVSRRLRQVTDTEHTSLMGLTQSLIEHHYLDVISYSFVPLKEVNNRAESVNGIFYFLPSETVDRITGFYKEFYGHPFEGDEFSDYLRELKFADIAKMMGVTVEGVREMNLMSLSSSVEQRWIMEKKVSEPLVTILKELEVPFSQSKKMTFGDVTKELLKLNVELFIAEKELNATKLEEASSKQLEDLKINGLIPHVFSINELASFISGQVNVSSMSNIFMQRIHMITTQSKFSEVLSNFGMTMDDYRKLPMSYFFNKILGMQPMKDQEYLDRITLADIEFLNPKDITDPQTFDYLTKLANKPMLQVLTQPFNKFRYDLDIVSLINTQVPQFDKMTIFQTLKNALDAKHGEMVDQKHSDQLYELLVKNAAYTAHSTSSDRIIDALNSIRFKSEHPELFKPFTQFFPKAEPKNIYNGRQRTMYFEGMLDQPLVDVMETFGVTNFSHLQKEYKFNDIYKDVTFRDIANCQIAGVQNLYGVVWFLQDSTKSKGTRFYPGLKMSFAGVSLPNLDLDNIGYCKKINEYYEENFLDKQMKSVFGNDYNESIAYFGFDKEDAKNLAMVKFYKNDILVQHYQGKFQERMNRVLMNTTLGHAAKKANMTLERVTARRLRDIIQFAFAGKDGNVSTSADLDNFVDLEGGPFSLFWAMPTEEVGFDSFDKPRKEITLFEILSKITLHSGPKIEEQSDKPMVVFATKAGKDWLSVMKQKPIDILSMASNVSHKMAFNWFNRGRIQEVWRKSLEDIFFKAQWHKYVDKKKFMFLTFKNLLNDGRDLDQSNRAKSKVNANLFKMNMEELQNVGLIGSSKVGNMKELLNTVFTDQELKEGFGLPAVRYMERLRPNMFEESEVESDRSLNSNMALLKVRGKEVMETMLDMQIISLMHFCDIRPSESLTLEDIMTHCSGYSLKDLHKEFGSSIKALYHARHRTLMEIAHMTNMTKDDVHHMNIRQIATLAHFKKASFMFQPLFSMAQENSTTDTIQIGNVSMNAQDGDEIARSWTGASDVELAKVAQNLAVDMMRKLGERLVSLMSGVTKQLVSMVGGGDGGDDGGSGDGGGETFGPEQLKAMEQQIFAMIMMGISGGMNEDMNSQQAPHHHVQRRDNHEMAEMQQQLANLTKSLQEQLMKTQQEIFGESLSEFIRKQTNGKQVFGKVSSLAKECGIDPMQHSVSLAQIARQCNISKKHTSLFDMRALQSVSVEDLMKSGMLNDKTDLFSTFLMADSIMKSANKPIASYTKFYPKTILKDVIEEITGLKNASSVFQLDDAMGMNLSAVAISLGFRDAKQLKFLSIQDIINIYPKTQLERMTVLQRRQLQRARQTPFEYPKAFNSKTFLDVIEYYFSITPQEAQNMFRLSNDSMLQLGAMSIDQIMKTQKRMLKFKSRDDVSLMDLITYLTKTFSKPQLFTFLSTSPFELAKNLNETGFTKMKTLTDKTGFNKADLKVMVMNVFSDKMARYVDVDSLSDKFEDFDFHEYKKKVFGDFKPLSILDMTDDLMYTMSMDGALEDKLSEYGGDQSMPLDKFMRPNAESPKGVRQAIGKLFRSKVINKILNKTSEDYQSFFGSKPDSNIRLKDLIMNYAFGEEFEDQETHIVGVGSTDYHQPILKLLNHTIGEILKSRYNTSVEGLAMTYPKFKKINFKRFAGMTFKQLATLKGMNNESFSKPQKLLNMNFDELINFFNGSRSMVEVKKSVEARIQMLQKNSITELYNTYTKSEQDVPDRNSKEKLLKISSEFFGDTQEDVENRYSISSKKYNYLDSMSYKDVWYLFRMSPQGDGQSRRRRSTHGEGEMDYDLTTIINKEPEFSFFMQQFDLQSFNKSILHSLPQENITNKENLEASLSQIIQQNHNSTKYVALFTLRDVNHFFFSIKNEYEEMRVIDAVQGIIAANDKNICARNSSYCSKSISSGACSTEEEISLCTCAKGFKLKPAVAFEGATCTDINECANNPCHASATCTNTVGSYLCKCKPGYSGNGFNCTDVNECADGPCDDLATCTNSVGSFMCECPEGKSGDGFKCNDLCSTNNTCNADHSTCVNVESGILCICNKLAASPECDCNQGKFYDPKTKKCADVKQNIKVKDLKLNKEFKPEMTSRTSKAFKKVAALVKNQIMPVIVSKVPNAIGIEVTDIRKGSIVVDFIVLMNTTNATTPEKLTQTLLEANTTGQLKDLQIQTMPIVQDTNPCKLGIDNCVENAVCVADVSSSKNYRCECTGDNEWEGGECITDAATKRFLKIGLPILIILIVIIVVALVICHNTRKQRRSDSKRMAAVSNPAYVRD